MANGDPVSWKWRGPALVALALSGCVRYPQPTLVSRENHGYSQHYVVGLPRGHGWIRGGRVVGSQPLLIPGLQSWTFRPVVVAAVTERYGDAVQISVLCQHPETKGMPLTNAKAVLLDRDETERIRFCWGRIIDRERRGTAVKLNLGREDDVHSGDIYDVIEPNRLHTVGRVQIQDEMRIDRTSAWAEIIDAGQMPIGIGLDVIYSASVRDYAGAKLKVLVLRSNDSPDGNTARVRHTSSKDLTFSEAVLKAAARLPGIQVQKVVDRQLMAVRSETALERLMNTIGVQHQADLVILGNAECSAQELCTVPRYVVLKAHGRADQDSDDKERPSVSRFMLNSRQRNTSLASLVLSDLVYRARRFADVIFLLKSTIEQDPPEGEDLLRVEKYLSDSYLEREQYYLARRHAEALVLSSKEQLNRDWEAQGHVALAKLNVEENHSDRAKLELGKTGSGTNERSESELQARLQCVQGQTELRDGNVSRAQSLLDSGAELGERLHDMQGLMECLRALVALARQTQQWDAANRHLHRLLKLAARHGDRRLQGQIHRELADVAVNQGNSEAALDHLREAVSIEVINSGGAARTLHEHALMRARKGEYGVALALLLKSLKVGEQRGDLHGRADTLLETARMELRLGQVAGAQRHLKMALSYRKRLGEVAGQAQVLCELGEVASRQGRARESRRSFRDAMESFRLLTDRYGQACVYFGLSRREAVEGHGQAAVLHFEQGLVTVSPAAVEPWSRRQQSISVAVREFQHNQADTLVELGELALRSRKIDIAREYFQRALEIYTNLGLAQEQQAMERRIKALSNTSRPTPLKEPPHIAQSVGAGQV